MHLVLSNYALVFLYYFLLFSGTLRRSGRSVLLTSLWQQLRKPNTFSFFPPATSWKRQGENTDLCWRWISNTDTCLQILGTSALISVTGASTPSPCQDRDIKTGEVDSNRLAAVDYHVKWTDCGHYPGCCQTGAWLIQAERSTGPDNWRSVTFDVDGYQLQVKVRAEIYAWKKTYTSAA